jgi:hypothetical protein
MAKNTQTTLNAGTEHAVEVHTDQTPEPVLALEGLDKVAREEAFMNEMVEILVHTTTDENAPPMVLLNVNGTNQPIPRGVPVKVRRKYVEVLARCKETKYRQPDRDMMNPEQGNEMLGRTGQVYPFQLVSDPNPKGPAWLAAVQAEAA